MKKILIKIILPIVTILIGAVSCSDWTDMERKFEEITDGSDFPDQYYEQLRAYKASDHPVTFGWFGNWTGKGASLEKSLAGLPDSVDFVSLWGNWRNPGEEQLKDLRFVQEVKGTRALMCFIVANVGDQLTPEEHKDNYKEFWGWVDDDEEAIKNSIEMYANAICDTIDKYNYDGFDIDYEPNYGSPGNLASYDKNMAHFVKTLGKRIGPKSGTNRLLVVDGEPQTIASETGEWFDYFIVQAYYASGDRDLDNRLNSTIRNFDGYLTPEEVARKYIVTENFEDLALKGGTSYTDRYGNTMQSLEGMARWAPIINGKKIRKGGIGTYHMEYEFVVPGHDGTYPFLRNATRIMNPSVK